MRKRLARKVGSFFGTLFTVYKFHVYQKFPEFKGANFISRTLAKLSQIGMEKIDEEPEDIFSREWDNLVVLDACRHDYYEEVVGESDYRISKASATPEFLMENFQEGDHQDVIYISANPQFAPEKFRQYTGREPEDVFFMVYDLYDTEWDDELSTVHPSDIVKHAKAAEKLYPDKRKIIHFMQPHGPSIVEREGEAVNVGGAKKVYDSEITLEEYREYYRESIDFVMGYVERLSQELEGKTVVTSDHGELVGENRVLAMQHPLYLDSEALRKVPWDKIS